MTMLNTAQVHTSWTRLAPFSEHRVINTWVTLQPEHSTLAYWHFNNSLLENVDFMTAFQEFWLAWHRHWKPFP